MYLPFMEMTLSLMACPWPAEMVAVAAEPGAMHRKKSKVGTMRWSVMKDQRGGELVVAETTNAGLVLSSDWSKLERWSQQYRTKTYTSGGGEVQSIYRRAAM